MLDADVVERAGGREIHILHAPQLIAQLPPHKVAQCRVGIPPVFGNGVQLALLKKRYHLGLVITLLQRKRNIERRIGKQLWQ